MRTLLICHDNEPISRDGLARWLASTSELAGIVVIHETGGRLWRRIRREVRRGGVLRFLDVLAFRLYYAAALKEKDRRWERDALARLAASYPPVPAGTPVSHVQSPNSREAEAFIRGLRPDIMIARCKTLLRPGVFSIPSKGTFVMHPGICPEYRNAHGCFWALAQDDLENVGMTLLRIDKGIDTGPIYGYYRPEFDETDDSHVVIQAKAVLDNLDRIGAKLREVHEGRATPMETAGRPSAEWGQPWLTSYLAWKARARARRRERGEHAAHAPVS